MEIIFNYMLAHVADIHIVSIVNKNITIAFHILFIILDPLFNLNFTH